MGGTIRIIALDMLDHYGLEMLLCTNMSPSEAGKVFNQVKREVGTQSDNSFCIYAIDTKERNIYITFFGAYLPEGTNSEEYPEVQVISY